MKNIRFAYNVRKLRTEKGLTQTEVARAIDCSKSAVQKWEAGSTFPTLELLALLAELFDVTLDELAFGEMEV